MDRRRELQDAKFYDHAESVPGPTVDRFAAIAKELGIVMILPVYEQEQPGLQYNTAAADPTPTVRWCNPDGHHVHPRRNRVLHPRFSAGTFETGTRAAAWGGSTTIVDFAIQTPGTAVLRSG